MKIHSTEEIKAALSNTGGNIAAAARGMGMTRGGLAHRIAKSPSLRQYVADQREEFVDIAESALKQEVEDHNITAIIFALKTLGRTRGYIDRQELGGRVEVSGESTVQVVVYLPDNGRDHGGEGD